jgi:hypothetical protein
VLGPRGDVVDPAWELFRDAVRQRIDGHPAVAVEVRDELVAFGHREHTHDARVYARSRCVTARHQDVDASTRT